MDKNSILPVTKQLPNILTKWGKCLKCETPIGDRYGHCKQCEIKLNQQGKARKQMTNSNSTTDYNEFLLKKIEFDKGSGIDIPESSLNPMLFPFQNDITRWSLRKGRTLIGLNCGLGKGPIQMEFSKQVHIHTGKPVIMFAPPGVKFQFASIEGPKFGYSIHISNEEKDIIDGINITNYERLTVRERVKISDYKDYLVKYEDYSPVEIKRNNIEVQVERFRFNPYQFGGICLDEGSILKHYNAKTRDDLTRFAKSIQFRLVATATPAPNDYMELINYSEFLGIMDGKQARAKFFIQDGQTSNKYRIMKSAWKPFWRWVATWAVMIRQPSDLGYDDNGYILPELGTKIHVLNDENIPDGMLIPVPAKSLQEQSKVKRLTIEDRCQLAADIANADSDHKVIYCRLNDEGVLLQKLIPGSVEVAGRHSDDEKEDRLIGFATGKYPILITKPEIGGFGLNFQGHCHRVISVNINHSSEEMYQYIRRVYRYGQPEKVQHDIISMDTEGDIMVNIQRKEKQSDTIFAEIVKNMDIHELHKKIKREIMDYKTGQHKGKYWELLLGDSVENVNQLEDQSVGMVVTSVPFPAMYVYTNSERDIGNYDTVDGLLDHLKYVFINLLPKMIPGRICHIHLAQAVAHLNREGVIGLMDFRGPLVQMMIEAGWVFHGERTIEKDPQTERARNNTLGLMQKTLMNDAAHMRASVSDYLVEFRAPGTNPTPINALLSDPNIQGNYVSPDGWITMDMWINWASNVWYKYRKGMKWWEGIDVTNVCGAMKKEGRQGFGVADGKGIDDEKHLCELQLDVIERCIALHSNPGELVIDPFNGIGSSGLKAIEMGRRYWGSELKDSYYYTSIKNLQWAEAQTQQMDFFDLLNGNSNEDELIRIHKKWMSSKGISLLDRATKWDEWEKDASV